MADRDDSNATRTSAEAAALTVGSAGEDGVKAAAGKAPLATKTKVGISVLAAASLLLIAIAAFALAGGLSAPDGAAQVDGSDSASLSVQPTAGSTGLPDAALDANSQAADSPEGGTSQAQADAPSQTSEGAGQAATTEPTDSPFGDNGATASAPAAGNAPVSGSTASGSSSQPSTDAPPAQNAVNVSVSVDSFAAGGGVSASGSFSFAPGATPLRCPVRARPVRERAQHRIRHVRGRNRRAGGKGARKPIRLDVLRQRQHAHDRLQQLRAFQRRFRRLVLCCWLIGRF